MNLDKLNNNSVIVSFTKKVKVKDRDYYEWRVIWVHRKCRAKVKLPAGWQKFSK